MSYTPTKGVFVNGKVADATDMLNELVAISTATQGIETKVTTDTTKTLTDSKKYTDDQLTALAIDGGTF